MHGILLVWTAGPVVDLEDAWCLDRMEWKAMMRVFRLAHWKRSLTNALGDPGDPLALTRTPHLGLAHHMAPSHQVGAHHLAVARQGPALLFRWAINRY